MDILDILREVEHPAKGDRNIVELGMVDQARMDGNKVVVVLAFPKHRDPLAEYLIGSCKAALIRHGIRRIERPIGGRWQNLRQGPLAPGPVYAKG